MISNITKRLNSWLFNTTSYTNDVTIDGTWTNSDEWNDAIEESLDFSIDLLVAIIYSVIGKELKWILSINKILT